MLRRRQYQVRKVSIESPLKPIGRHGSSEEDHKREYEENVAYARAAMLDCIQRGEAPFASHLLYTQVLDDAEADERKTGMRAGMHIGDAMDARVVYIDLGVSVGMRAAITRAESRGQHVEMRELGKRWHFTWPRAAVESKWATTGRRS